MKHIWAIEKEDQEASLELDMEPDGSGLFQVKVEYGVAGAQVPATLRQLIDLYNALDAALSALPAEVFDVLRRERAREEAQALIGKYCDFHWIESDCEPGGMEGWVWQVYERDGEVWVAVDYGYAAQLNNVVIQEIDPPTDEYWDAEAGTSRKRKEPPF